MSLLVRQPMTTTLTATSKQQRRRPDGTSDEVRKSVHDGQNNYKLYQIRSRPRRNWSIDWLSTSCLMVKSCSILQFFIFMNVMASFLSSAIAFSKAQLVPVSKGKIAGAAIEACSLWNDGPVCFFVVRRPG